MRRVVGLLGLPLVLAACLAATPSPTAIPTATGTATAATPTAAAATPTAAATASPAAATARPTPTPVPVAGCPTGSPLTVREYVEADPACFDGVDVTVRGWLDTPPPLGFEPPFIEPAWLFYPPSSSPTLFTGRPTNPDHICTDVSPECPWFFLHIDPASELTLEVEPRWLLATGHRGDPAAVTCHWVDPDGLQSPLPPVADAIVLCRESFVLVSFRDAP